MYVKGFQISNRKYSKGIGQLLLKLKVAIRLLKLVICSKIMKGFIVGLLINHLVTFILRKTKHFKSFILHQAK